MNIDSGESLIYSWLRHVKECQVIQTGWRPAPHWELANIEFLEKLRVYSYEAFSRLGYEVFTDDPLKDIVSAEKIGVLGVCVEDADTAVYAVNVAFGDGPLDFGQGPHKTITRITHECLCTVMCLCGYMNIISGEVIYATPKIEKETLSELLVCISFINKLMQKVGLKFNVRLIVNEEFENHILRPALIASKAGPDDTELFLKGYQLYSLFASDERCTEIKTDGHFRPAPRVKGTAATVAIQAVKNITFDGIEEMKIGKIAKNILWTILEEAMVPPDEIAKLQTLEYSKSVFAINFPLLVKEGEPFERQRYYVNPIYIRGEAFLLCSQWFTRNRAPLLDWVRRYVKASGEKTA